MGELEMMPFGKGDLFGRKPGLEGHAAEAEERRAARAQENLTACRAGERAGRERRNKNPRRSVHGIEVD
jgi:hypothetical protein